MTGLVRLFVMTTAALLAAAVLYVVFTLPPRAISLDPAPPPTVALGAYHVHSDRSDGSGSVDAIAQAAADAGLSFVVFTDHGDATRRPDPPAYVRGVLCLDATEISTSDGHVVALGLTTASPYPLAGTARAVFEDVHRQGGRAVIAHPDSPRPGLQWQGRGGDFDGIEWLNADSEWRDDSFNRVAAAAARSIFRPAESIASLFDRPVRSLQRWDAAASTRPVFGLAAVDAHASLGFDDEDKSSARRTMLAQPTYADLFRTLAQAVVLERPLTGRAEADAAVVLGALISGRSYSVVRALGSAVAIDFTARQEGPAVGMGQQLPRSGLSTTFGASVPAAPGALLRLFQDGREVASGRGSLAYRNPGIPGAYRVEAYLPNGAVPWLVTNPIHVGPFADPPVDTTSQLPRPTEFVALGSEASWAVEHDPASSGSIVRDGEFIGLNFDLGPGEASGQYGALVASVAAESGFDRVRFIGRASRPMRISVQLRLPGGPEGQRWGTSIYFDTMPRPITVRLEDLVPIGTTSTQQPIIARVRGVLLVVDTVNTLPGSSGTFWVSDVLLGVGHTGG